MSDELDEKAIVERIRARLRETAFASFSVPPATPRPPGVADSSPETLDSDAAMLRESHDIYERPLRSQRALAPVAAMANRILRKLLRPSLERQVNYNAANERLVQALLREVAALRKDQGDLRRRCEALEERVNTLRPVDRHQ